MSSSQWPKKPSGAAYKKMRLLQDSTDCTEPMISDVMSHDDEATASTEKCEEAGLSTAQSFEETEATLSDDSESEKEEIGPQKSPQQPDAEMEPTSFTSTLDLSDPADWPDVITDSVRDRIVQQGPAKPIKCFAFPKDASDRCFTTVHYSRRLPNGEQIKRNWVIYSIKINRIFCFCCKLFGKLQMSITKEGYGDWKNVSHYLCTHEISRSHLAAMQAWTELSIRLESGQTIDQTQRRLMATETRHWQNVLQRLIAIVRYLGEQCLAFRGSSDVIYTKSNGNYLKLVEMLATFDTVMQEHLKRIHNNEIQHHYLAKTIQNEIIGIISQEILRRILQLVKEAKYYSIILDCTPDVNNVEQMSIVIRFVLIKKQDKSTAEPEVNIEEKFLGFLPVHSSPGAGLTEAFLAELESLKIPVCDMRGQGYDNGSNMKGKHSGVQERILDLNSRAFYVPCSAHSLNLVVNDAADSCKEATSFFNVVQKIYGFFSSSTQRWEVLEKHISRLTVKNLSPTRWSSRIEAIEPFFHHPGEIYDALLEISKDATYAPYAKDDAELLAKELQNYRFICFIVVWYHILTKINIVSKLLQSPSMYLPEAIDLLEATKLALEDYRSDTGFETLLQESKKLALAMEIDPVFPEASSVRPRKTKILFSYEGEDPAKDFEVNVFYAVLDAAVQSVGDRFTQIQQHSKYFNFLYDIRTLKDASNEDLLEWCMKLQKCLTDDKSQEADIDGVQLCEELTVLSDIVKPNMTPAHVLASALRNGFAPNVAIALRILLTLPITVASDGRNFSKLKLIKNYLRSTMSQERLVGLAMISIEHDTALEINFHTLLQEFAHAKARKVAFR